MPATTIENTLADAAKKLAVVSESPALDAETLLAWVLGVSRSHLFAHPGSDLGKESARRFSNALARRHDGEPVAYITGAREFWSLRLRVTPDTLVPRPETETLVEQALSLIPRGRACRVLDLGTGSGAIAIALASERPESEIVATDSSGEALNVARQNAAQHTLVNIHFLEGDWIEPVADEVFEFIVSNPPYVKDDDPALDELRYEPGHALRAGPDGLDAIRNIAEAAPRVISDNGTLILEHGADQRDAVAGILQNNGWSDIECFRDLSGHPRVTTARIKLSTREAIP
ncbi:MAG: peptide chain release factor N(5)-glutamine methyltransferase [Woeseia sp.]